MIVKIIDIEKLVNRHACFGPDSSFKPHYEVLAIIQSRKRKMYLVEDDPSLYWWDADLFEVIDESIPEDWISVCYKGRFHRLKNANYDFSIPINSYQGPKEFLDNLDFFFDITEEPYEAYWFYCCHLKRNMVSEETDLDIQ